MLGINKSNMMHFSYLGEESWPHTQAPALEYGT